MKPTFVFGDTLADVGAPAVRQFAQAASDEVFEVNVTDGLISLGHHHLRDTKTRAWHKILNRLSGDLDSRGIPLPFARP